MTNYELDTARAAEAAKNVKRVGVWGGSLDVYTISAIREAARLAREGWVPPEPVDPDLVEADTIRENSQYMFGAQGHIAAFLHAIKRGRELERAEAKPGVVWVKHDGSSKCPIASNLAILTKTAKGYYWNGDNYNCGRADSFNWREVTHYCEITQPEKK